MRRATCIAIVLATLIGNSGCDSGGNTGSKKDGTSRGGHDSGGAESTGGKYSSDGGIGPAGANTTSSDKTSAIVTVSGATPLPVSAVFFGQNYWSWVPDWGDPVGGVEAQVAAVGIRILRAGGSNNDKQAPAPFSLAEIDQFVAFAKAIGAAPLLQVPILKNLSGSAATAQDAADFVAYVNQTQGYAVPYFSIGNEPDLYTEQGFFDSTYNASAYCSTFRAFASAMKAVDPTIKILGPELSWKYQSGSNDWLTPFLKECGDAVDIVAVHRYPIDPAACSESAAYGDATRFRDAIGHVRALMAATGQSAKPLAFTETNITWDGTPEKSNMPASPGTFPAGLWVADAIGIALESSLHSLSFWSLSEGWTLGFFSGTTPRPALHVLKLFSSKFGTEVLKVTGSPTGTSIYAGRDALVGKTTLFVVNKSTKTLELSIKLTELPRSEVPKFDVAPISLSVVELLDDGTVPAVTEYQTDMAAPTSKTPLTE